MASAFRKTRKMTSSIATWPRQKFGFASMRQNCPFFHSLSWNGPEATSSVAAYVPISSALTFS